jgi:acrylyl-CoA reductase (NADPH)
MFYVLALEQAGIASASGAVRVTAAAGGVGSIAIRTPPQRCYHVAASSRRAEQEADYLRGLGEAEIIRARDLSEAGSRLACF